MSMLRESGGFVFCTLAASALLWVGGTMNMAAAAEPVYFEGKADLCAIDNSEYREKTQGDGVDFTKGSVQLFRIDTNHGLMKGWEVLSFDTKTFKSGTTISSYEAFFEPDGVGAGALIDKSKVVMTAPPAISGTYRGTGSLKGVTVDYELTINMVNPEYCLDHPYCETPGAQCVYLSDIGQPPFSWTVTGYVSGWDGDAAD